MTDNCISEKWRWVSLLLTSSVVSMIISSGVTYFTQRSLQQNLFSQEKLKAFVYDYYGIKQKVINTRSNFFNVADVLSEAIDLRVKGETINETYIDNFRQVYNDFLINLEALRMFVICYGGKVENQTHKEIFNILGRIRDLLIDKGVTQSSDDVTEHLNPLYKELQTKMPKLLEEADESILQKIEELK
ncbi:MAG: hypothetical protein K2Y18_02110 [Alphaproteobacteria bacterium]|nr:hypothetical protein [Alphaproteobacteria bacterium]